MQTDADIAYSVSGVQVVGISRLSKTGWAKIAHHLGRSGSSAVSGIKLKYRNLKERAGSSPATDLPAASSMPGRLASFLCAAQCLGKNPQHLHNANRRIACSLSKFNCFA